MPHRDIFCSASDNLNVATPLFSTGLHASSVKKKKKNNKCLFMDIKKNFFFKFLQTVFIKTKLMVEKKQINS